jgi:hypothetical protein
LTLPGFLYIHNSHIPNAGKGQPFKMHFYKYLFFSGVFAKVDIPAGIVFGKLISRLC